MIEPGRDGAKSVASASGSASGRRTPKSLLERVRDNDAAAWHRLVHLYSPLVYYWCGQSGVRPPDAEDVLQEVLRTAATRLSSFRHDRPGDTFRGWLRGITRNMLLQHHRQKGRQAQAVGGSAAWQQLQGVAGGPEAAPAAEPDDPPAELNGLYRRALELVRGEFEDRTWQAFWKVAVDGRKPADVALDLGVSSAAVRQAKSRVLRRLKEEIGDLGD